MCAGLAPQLPLLQAPLSTGALVPLLGLLAAAPPQPGAAAAQAESSPGALVQASACQAEGMDWAASTPAGQPSFRQLSVALS